MQNRKLKTRVYINNITIMLNRQLSNSYYTNNNKKYIAKVKFKQRTYLSFVASLLN